MKQTTILSLKQLLRHSSIYFQKNQGAYNSSFTLIICQLMLIKCNTNIDDVKIVVKCFDQWLLNLTKKLGSNSLELKMLFEWIQVILINFSTLNQQYSDKIENQLALSTAENSHKNSNREYKSNKQTQTIILYLKKGVREWFISFINGQWVYHMSRMLNSNYFHCSKYLVTLLQTIDYFITKYSVKCNYYEQINNFLARNQDSNIKIEEKKKAIHIINEVIFNMRNKQTVLNSFLQGNLNYNINAICKIIQGNYHNTTHPSSIYKNTLLTGRRLIQACIDELIQTTAKNDLFSQKMEQSSQLFALLLSIFRDRFTILLVECIQILLVPLMKSSTNTYSDKFLRNLQYFIDFIQFKIPQKYPELHYLYRYIYRTLLHYYPQNNEAIELMKKLILNRILLNPENYIQYYKINSQQQLQQYVKSANKIRILFYPKKLDLLKQPNNKEIKEKSNQLQQSFRNMLTSKNKYQEELGVFVNDKPIYLSDHIIIRMCQNLNICTIKTEQYSHSQEYSLSFSFLKNQQQKSASKKDVKSNSSHKKKKEREKQKKQKSTFSVIQEEKIQQNYQLQDKPKFGAFKLPSSQLQNQNFIQLSHPISSLKLNTSSSKQRYQSQNQSNTLENNLISQLNIESNVPCKKQKNRKKKLQSQLLHPKTKQYDNQYNSRKQRIQLGENKQENQVQQIQYSSNSQQLSKQSHYQKQIQNFQLKPQYQSNFHEPLNSNNLSKQSSNYLSKLRQSSQKQSQFDQIKQNQNNRLSSHKQLSNISSKLKNSSNLYQTQKNQSNIESQNFQSLKSHQTLNKQLKYESNKFQKRKQNLLEVYKLSDLQQSEKQMSNFYQQQKSQLNYSNSQRKLKNSHQCSKQQQKQSSQFSSQNLNDKFKYPLQAQKNSLQYPSQVQQSFKIGELLQYSYQPSEIYQQKNKKNSLSKQQSSYPQQSLQYILQSSRQNQNQNLQLDPHFNKKCALNNKFQNAVKNDKSSKNSKNKLSVQKQLQLNHQSSQNLPDIALLYLIKLRRQYGQFRKINSESCNSRRQHRESIMQYLLKQHQYFMRKYTALNNSSCKLRFQMKYE